ncbi:hypothetical protein JCM3770_006217 [Rhodotorula araucariae]
MPDAEHPGRAPGPPSPTTTTTLLPPVAPGAPPSRDAARAKLAAALLGHDLCLDPLDPSFPVHSSAVLGPYKHLLAVGPVVATPANVPSPTSSFELVDALDQVGRLPPGAYSAPSATSDGGHPLERRPSLAGSEMWSTHGYERAATPLELDPDEEERLTSEWGLDEVMSNVSDSVELSRTGSTGLTGAEIARFAGSSARSEAGMPTRDDTPADEDEAVEVLETRSMPDLDRPRPISFVESVLDGLEERLAKAPASKAPLQSTRSDLGDSCPDGPRIKIIERTATQRRRQPHRLGTPSAGAAVGLSSLPSLADLSGDGSVGGLDSVSSGTRAGIASRDSLFLGPASLGVSRRSSMMSAQLSEGLSDRRASTDAGITSRPVSRLSLAVPTDTILSNRSASPVSSSDPTAHRPSTSRSVSPGPGFTSRFDPLVITAQRAELAKSRPAFANPDAGKPPRVVLMPAPLAGRPPSPPRRERVEGPGWAAEESPDEEARAGETGEEENEDAPGLREPLRPAGALYGRSLMDVMAERRALLKAQQRAYVPGTDGRRSMFEWKAQQPPSADDPLARHEGHTTGADVDEREDEDEDDVPLALVPADTRERWTRAESPVAARKARASIFGPDLVYQRELARAKEIEEIERAEKEAAEEQRRAKEDRRKSKGKLVKGAKRRSQLALNEAQPQEWKPHREPESEREWVPQREQEDVEELVEHTEERASSPLQRRNSLAPSLSIPIGLDAGLAPSASGGDWFTSTTAARPGGAAPDSDNDDDDDDFRPRPISLVGGHMFAGAARRRMAFDSSGSSSEGSDDDEGTSHIRPVDGRPSPPAMDSDDEDERPLGQRFSRASLMPLSAQAPKLQLDFGGDGDEHLANAEDGASDEDDDKPLGARFSTIRPVDEDDVPLAIHRLSLAPHRFEPAGTLHALDDDGRTVSDDSDDRPLGLKAGPHLTTAMPASSFYPSHAGAGSYAPVAPALPYSYSQYSLPLGPAMAVHVPGFANVAPDPHTQLALAQMQMQAAIQQQAAGDPAAAGPAGMIARWRREVSG